MLDNREGVVRLLVGARDFSFLANRPYRFSKPSQRRIQQVQGVLSSGSNCQTDHSPSSSSEVKNECSRTSTPIHAFSVCTRTVLTFIIIAFTLLLYTESQLKERYDVRGPVRLCQSFLFWSCPFCPFLKQSNAEFYILFLGSANRWRGRRSVYWRVTKMAISATGDREMPTAFGRKTFISKYWKLHERNGSLRKPWPRTGIYS